MAFLTFLRSNAPFLAAGALLTFLSSFGQTFFISVFAGEIRVAFNLSHGDWGALYSLGTTASAIVMVWAGALTDRYRVRALAPVVLIGLAAACLFMAINPFVWLLPIVVFTLRFFGQGMANLVAVVAMGRWFVATRGRALAIATLGVAAGEATLPLLFVSLLGFINWHFLWAAAAVFILLATTLIAPLLRMERTPQSIAEGSQSTGMNGKHWTRRMMLRHWLFWLILPALLAPSTFITAFFFHQVHLAEIKGWSHVQLVALFPLYSGMGVLGLLISGWLVDKFGALRLMPLFQIPHAIGFFIFGGAENLPIAIIAIVFMGLSQGAGSTIPTAFWAEAYGTRNIGSIKSLAVAVMVLGSAIGPALTGYLIDAGIDFPDQMAGISIYILCAASLVAVGMSRARPLLSAPA